MNLSKKTGWGGGTVYSIYMQSQFWNRAEEWDFIMPTPIYFH